MRVVSQRQVSFWLLLLAVSNTGILLVASFLSFTPSTHHHHHSSPAFSSNKDGNDYNGVNQPFSIHVVTTNYVILPGERTSLALTDEEAIPLIENCLQNDGNQPPHSSRVALAVCLEETNPDWNIDTCGGEDEDELALVQIASLCDTVGMNVGKHDDQVQMDLQCVGRIRLLHMEQQYSATHFRFRGEWIDESFHNNNDFEKAKRMENNIHALLKKISQMEQQVLSTNHSTSVNKLLHSVGTPSNNNTQLYHNFTETNAKVTQALSRAFRQGHNNATTILEQYSNDVDDDNDNALLRLTAMSWAVFLCLNNEKLETKYRLQALDWDNLLERIKLSQYVLREKQLLLQGQLLQLHGTSSSNPNSIISAMDQDAFQ